MLRKGVAATEAERTADEKFRELESKKEASKREREAAALRVAQLQAELQAAEESTKRQSVGGNMSAQVAAERRRTRDAEEKLRAHEDAERRLKAEHERQIGDLEERLNAIQVMEAPLAGCRSVGSTCFVSSGRQRPPLTPLGAYAGPKHSTS